MNAKFKSIINRRQLLLLMGGVIGIGLLSLAGVYVYYGFRGLPDSLIFRRTARYFCIKCGSQAVSHMTSVLDAIGTTPEPKVAQPAKISGVDSKHCEHTFSIIASHDRYIDLSSLRFRQWNFGKVEGEPFWSEPSLVTAFTTLSRSNLQDSSELFSYLVSLHMKGKVSGNLLEALTTTNAGEVMELLHQAYTNSGNALTSQRRAKR